MAASTHTVAALTTSAAATAAVAAPATAPEPARDSQLQGIIDKALTHPDPLIQAAIKREQTFRQRTSQELNDLKMRQARLRAQFEAEETKRGSEVTSMQASIQDAVMKGLGNAAVQIGLLTEEITAYHKRCDKENLDSAVIPLSSNKMHLAIKGAQVLLSTEFNNIFSGIVPAGYSFEYVPNQITILGNRSSLFGSSRGTFYKTAALTTYLASCKKTRLSDIALIDGEFDPWYKRSSLVYHAPIPAAMKLDKRFEDCFFLTADKHTFTYVHSGYAFGGGRDNSINIFAPEDCSSHVAKETKCRNKKTGKYIVYTTADQVCFYRVKMDAQLDAVIEQQLSSHASIHWDANAALKTAYQGCKAGMIPKPWLTAPELPTMHDLYDLYEVRDPQKLNMGEPLVYCHRVFNTKIDDEMTKTLGTGGHTGIILGSVGQGKDTQLAILSYSRAMAGDSPAIPEINSAVLENTPGIEGYGVQLFPLSSPGKKVMLFSMKKPSHSLHELAEPSAAQGPAPAPEPGPGPTPSASPESAKALATSISAKR